MFNEKKKKQVVPKLRQDVKVKADIVTSDDIKIYYNEKFQDFTARYVMNIVYITHFFSSQNGFKTPSVSEVRNHHPFLGTFWFYFSKIF